MAGNSQETRRHQFSDEECAQGGRTGRGGRPRNEVRDLARKHGAGCLPMLGCIVRSKSKGVRVRDKIEAARILLAYAYGQPKQSVEVATPEQAERIAALEAALEAALAADLGVEEL